jgi:transcription factor WhiB
MVPIAQDVAAAREQAADAIAVCEVCPVRAECLEFSLRHGSDFGAYGVWGGLVEAERRSLRRRWLGGTSVTELLSGTVEARETSHQHQGDRQLPASAQYDHATREPAVRTYGNLASEFDAPGHQALESELQRNLNTGQDQQAGLSKVLEVDPEATPPAWPLRGELLSHLDRLRRELQVGKPDARPRPRKELWRLPRMIRLRPSSV